MFFNYILFGAFVAVYSTCPQWQCSDKQIRKKDNPHCVEFLSENVSVAVQNTVCKSDKPYCFLLQAVTELNTEKYYELHSSAFCTSDVQDTSQGFQFSVESDFSTKKKELFFSPFLDCNEFNYLRTQCEADIFEEFTEEAESQIDDYINDINGIYSWNKCTENYECASGTCLCVPSQDTYGRCNSSEIDLAIVKNAQQAAACENDEASVCTLNEFGKEMNAVMWTSIIETDLDCLLKQTWELWHLGDYDLEEAMQWYKKASANLLILFSSAFILLA